jgi:hypothetical protein
MWSGVSKYTRNPNGVTKNRIMTGLLLLVEWYGCCPAYTRLILEKNPEAVAAQIYYRFSLAG